MALGIVLIICLVCCISSSLAAGFVFPIPQETPSEYKGFTHVASGRAFFQHGTDMSIATDNGQPTPEGLCAENCRLDFTCTGFNSWTEGTGFLLTSRCLKQTSNTSPWYALPARFTGKNNSNIFVKSS
jgi:hypothetical protein